MMCAQGTGSMVTGNDTVIMSEQGMRLRMELQRQGIGLYKLPEMFMES
jgi:predicted Fe-Mo cluster-binding NifX family protein